MKKNIIIIVISSMFISASATANIYAGSKVGRSSLNKDCNSNLNCSYDKLVFGAYAGYEVFDFLSLEASYDLLGDFSIDGSINNSVSAFLFAPKIMYSINPDVNFYSKVGSSKIRYNDDSFSSYFGAIGFEFLVDNNITMQLEYQHIPDINYKGYNISSNQFTIGFAYNFGRKMQPALVRSIDNKSPPITQIAPIPSVIDIPDCSGIEITQRFEFDSAVLAKDAKVVLAAASDYLELCPHTYGEINGYTDSVGSKSYNYSLSEKRANVVAAELNRKGIDRDRLMIKAHGKEGAIASNESALGRAENRRVEIVIHNTIQ
jgi:OOP family OmpA-OmpF porin